MYTLLGGSLAAPLWQLFSPLALRTGLAVVLHHRRLDDVSTILCLIRSIYQAWLAGDERKELMRGVGYVETQLGKNVIDHSLDGSERSLAQNEQFQAALVARPRAPLAWAYADLATIRAAGVAKPLLGGKSHDPGAELIFGGVLSTLHKTPYATAQLISAGASLDLALMLPHDPAWIPREREFFFGPQHSGAAPPEIALPDTILEVRAYRGISGMWLHGPDLFNEEINAVLAKANSDLSTLFGGRPFAEEILGAIDGGLRFVAVRDSQYDASQQPAELHLPGFAVIARLKDPASSQRPLRIAFQTAVGLANLTGAQQGRPSLELETERSDAKTLLTASYSPDDFADGAAEMAMAAQGGGVLLQLSPTVAFAGDAIVLASTRSLANRLIDRLEVIANNSQESAVAASDSPSPIANSALRLRATPLRNTLSENRERLISQNMLEKGHDRDAASREIGGLLTLLEFFEQGDASLLMSPDQLQLSLRLFPSKE